MKRDLIIKLATAAVLYLLLPASLTAAELEIQLRTSGQTGKLEIRETLTVNYFDLGKPHIARIPSQYQTGVA